MNFSYDSVKLKSKLHNENFFFDKETSQGHFFAVLDFVPHDYANLAATLDRKLETVIGSLESVPNFSADLFLGFVEKEITNFLHRLGEQPGEPDMLCSAALCFVSGNQFSYLLCGDVQLDILTGGRLLPLTGVELSASDAPGLDSATLTKAVSIHRELERLGVSRLEATTAGRIQVLTLQNDDLVLVMTRVVAAGLDRAKLPDEVMSLGSLEPKLICDALMKASAASREDRTVVVICGPYQPEVELGFEDLRQAIAALEARVDNLVENDGRREVAALVSQREAGNTARQGQNLTQQILELKDDLAGKAAQIDLLELDEKLKDFGTVLQSKADTVAVLGLQRDVLKLRLVANATGPAAIETDDVKEKAKSEPASEAVKTEVLSGDIEEGHEEDESGVSPQDVNILETETALAGSARSDRSRLARAVLVVLLTAIAGVVVGGWLQSRILGNKQETWSVKTTANQIFISRLDGSGQREQGTVSLNVAEPLKATGEQTFSSFADVKRYVDTLTTPVPPSSPGQTSSASQANDKQVVEGVTEVTVKPGDTLQKLTQRYDVAPERLKELNPGITRWPAIRSGQRILVPSATPPSPTPSPSGVQATVQPAANNSVATIEVTVGPGDSLNRFVLRYNSTPERLRELNPQINDWGSIRAGQRLLVPAPPGG